MITVDYNKLKIKPGFKILDIGCGPGRHTCAFSRFKDVTVAGADINFNELVQAKEKLLWQDELGEGQGRWMVCASDITSLPFGDNYFDLVVCSEVLEHIPNHLAAIKEIVRVLKPGNNLVVSVPRYFPELICWALSDEYYKVNDGHIRIYKTKELVSLLENAGVRKWGKHFAHSIHSPYWWLKCLVGPTLEDSTVVNFYHKFLVWDIMKGPWITRFIDKMLNPVIGKSLVLYLKKRK